MRRDTGRGWTFDERWWAAVAPASMCGDRRLPRCCVGACAPPAAVSAMASALTYSPVAGRSLSAVLARVAASLVPVHYQSLLHIAGGLWVAAFALFVLAYAPVMLHSRPGE